MIHAGRLNELARRKAELVARCARQRIALAEHLDAWQTPIRAVDRGIAATRFFQAHPLAVAAVVGIVAVVARRRLLQWAGRGLLVWRSLRTVRSLLRTLSA